MSQKLGTIKRLALCSAWGLSLSFAIVANAGHHEGAAEATEGAAGAVMDSAQESATDRAVDAVIGDPVDAVVGNPVDAVVGDPVDAVTDSATDRAVDAVMGDPVDRATEGALDAATDLATEPATEPEVSDEGELLPDVSASPTSGEEYVVKRGDTLSKIAEARYGRRDASNTIFEANRSILSDPNVIEPGQVLTLP